MYDRIAIDCSSILYSNAYKLKKLTTSKELETGAMFGFMRNLLFMADYFHCNKFAFCWDSKGSDRKQMYPEYKASRKDRRKADPEMTQIFHAIIKQSKILKDEILPACGFRNTFTQEGKEADDLLANIVLYWPDILLVSGDDDMLQLLDLCDIWNPGKQELWNHRRFVKTYGIEPPEWAKVKAIAGCKSDDIAGVQGVGELTAIKWLKGLVNPKHKVYSNLHDSDGIINRNITLTKLPIRGTKYCDLVEDQLDYEGFKSICKKYEFYSFLDNLEVKWENFFRGAV